MVKLIATDLLSNKALTIIGLILLTLLALLADAQNFLLISMIMGLLIVFIAVGSTLQLKAYKIKNNAHRFLKSLPIKQSKIVIAESLFYVITIACSSLVSIVLLCLLLGKGIAYRYAFFLIMAFANFSLILTAVISLIHGFSAKKQSLKWFIVLAAMGVVVTVFFMSNDLSIDLAVIDRLVFTMNWFVVTGCCSAFYIAIMIIKIKLGVIV